jgi:hypothetical protein
MMLELDQPNRLAENLRKASEQNPRVGKTVADPYLLSGNRLDIGALAAMKITNASALLNHEHRSFSTLAKVVRYAAADESKITADDRKKRFKFGVPRRRL